MASENAKKLVAEIDMDYSLGLKDSQRELLSSAVDASISGLRDAAAALMKDSLVVDGSKTTCLSCLAPPNEHHLDCKILNASRALAGWKN